MISPYVRRLRLTQELRALRTQARLTHEQLGKRCGESRVQISRVENGHLVDQAIVMKMLDALGVKGERWTQVMDIAREAGGKGWWESSKGMGDRQQLFANLEAGAVTIREYHDTFVPGLLQIPEFGRARCDAEAVLMPLTYPVNGIVEGNVGRQRMLRRPDGPTYEAIIDEVAIRRLTAPPDVFKKQLYYLAQVVNEEPRLSLRVLPIDVRIRDYTVPRSAFSIYTYPDPGDSDVVAIGTVTSDVLLTEPADIRSYNLLYESLLEVTLAQDESLDLLTKTATELPDD